MRSIVANQVSMPADGKSPNLCGLSQCSQTLDWFTIDSRIAVAVLDDITVITVRHLCCVVLQLGVSACDTTCSSWIDNEPMSFGSSDIVIVLEDLLAIDNE